MLVQIGNRQSPIGNVDGRPTPAAPFIKKRSNLDSSKAQSKLIDFERRFNGCCWPRFQIRLHH
jgi:hypothetical protein